MKKIAKALLFALLIACSGNMQAAELDFFVDAFNFRDQDGKSFLEIHVNVNGESLYFAKNKNGKFQAGLDIALFLHDGNGEDGADALRIELFSPEIDDTNSRTKMLRLIDVRRIPIPEEGIYTLTGILSDKNDVSKRQYEFERYVSLSKPVATEFGLSDVIFIDRFEKTVDAKPYSKYGYDILPRIENDVFEDEDLLRFYVELYNTDKIVTGDRFFVHYYLTQVNSDKKQAEYQRTNKKTKDKLVIVQDTFDIKALPSQTYMLHIELYESGKMIGKKSRKLYALNSRISVDISVDPHIYDDAFAFGEEELSSLLKPMKFIATATESNFIDALQTFEEKKNYFVGYWQKRKQKNTDPIRKAFDDFKSRVDYANEHYRAYKNDGWRTDRGRVLIQYGAPNNVDYFVVDPNQYPHEIWRYNKIGTQANPIFVFYDPDGIVSDYPLLHSDVRGENNNPKWRLVLAQRVSQDGGIDATRGQRNFNTDTGSESDRR